MKSKLTAKQQNEIRALVKRPALRVDTSDIKPLDKTFWQQAVRNPFYRPIKQATTLRLDADVLVWLKSKGKGYQTRINHILREAMQEDSTAGH